MSQSRSILIAVGTLAPLLAIYAFLLWLSHQRRPDEEEAADAAAAADAVTAAPWIAAPPPAVRRRVRAALAHLTVAASPADGGATKTRTGAGSGKAGDVVDEEAPADADALCVICLDGWDDPPAVTRGAGGDKGGGGGEKDGGGGAGVATAPPRRGRTRLPCGHSFHPSCILRWAVKAPRCPLCNDDALGVAAAAAADVDAVAADGGPASLAGTMAPSSPSAVGMGASPAARRYDHHPLRGLTAAERVAVVSLVA